MVGNRNGHGIDALLLVEHPAVVLVALRVRVLREALGDPLVVDVGQGDDALASSSPRSESACPPAPATS